MTFVLPRRHATSRCHALTAEGRPCARLADRVVVRDGVEVPVCAVHARQMEART